MAKSKFAPQNTFIPPVSRSNYDNPISMKFVLVGTASKLSSVSSMASSYGVGITSEQLSPTEYSVTVEGNRQAVLLFLKDYAPRHKPFEYSDNGLNQGGDPDHYVIK